MSNSYSSPDGHKSVAYLNRLITSIKKDLELTVEVTWYLELFEKWKCQQEPNGFTLFHNWDVHTNLRRIYKDQGKIIPMWVIEEVLESSFDIPSSSEKDPDEQKQE
jgi:hypothetical protein